jgi:hypothetical protein
MLNAK